MAAWGTLMNIFENPMPDSLSSWSQLLPKAETDASFDVFGELCHRVKPDPSPVQTPRFNKSFLWNATISEPDDNAFEIFGELCYKTKPKPDADSSPGKPESEASSLLKHCTEGLGFESVAVGNDRVEKAGGGRCEAPDSGGKKGMMYMRSYSDVRPKSSNGGLTFPSPITSIGTCGKPRVYFKSYRKDGRFVLREVRIPTQQLLQSTRENGRLRMQVVDDNDHAAGKGDEDGEEQGKEEEKEEMPHHH